MIKNYKKFSSIRPLNEDVQMAKSFLQKRFLANKREDFIKKGGKPEEVKLVKLTPEEIKKAESDPNYILIRDFLLKENASGLIGPFLRFFYEGLDIKGIKELYQDFKSLKQFHNRLGLEGAEWPYTKLNGKPKTIVDYITKQGEGKSEVDASGNIIEIPGNTHLGYETLADDLEKLKICRTTKRWADNLPREYVITAENDVDKGKTIPSILDQCKNTTSPRIQREIMGIAKSFEDFGKDTAGNIDVEKNRQIYVEFFGRILDVPPSKEHPDGKKYIGAGKTWKSLNDVIIKANKALVAANNSNKLDYYNQLEKVNRKYGVLNGASVVFDEEGILIVQIFSFQANSELNAQTAHCITRNMSYWNTYVGGDEKYTSQYYLYNWNVPPSDDRSIIGITIDQNSRVTDCCDKSNHSFNMPDYIEKLRKSIPELKNILSMSIFSPMSKEQVDQKRRRVAANKKIIVSNITIKEIMTCIEDGGDPNAHGTDKSGSKTIIGKPLLNAVIENNHEKVLFLIDKGAQVTLCPCLAHAEDFEMLKILIRNGAEMDSEVFKKHSGSYKAVRYLLDFGMDYNFQQGFPIRTAVDTGNRDVIDLLFSRGVDFSERNYIAITKAISKPALLEHLISLLKNKKYTMVEDCKTCHGETEIYKNKGTREERKEDCPHCNGTGKEPGGKLVEKVIRVKGKYQLKSFVEHIDQINDETYKLKTDKPKLISMMLDYGLSTYSSEDVKEFLEDDDRLSELNSLILIKPILQKLENYRDLLTEEERKGLKDTPPKKTK